MSCCVWLDSQSRLETCGMPSRLHFHSTMKCKGRIPQWVEKEGASVVRFHASMVLLNVVCTSAQEETPSGRLSVQ